MSAVYWALMGMALMGRDLEAEMELGKIVEWVLECQHPNGGCASTHCVPPAQTAISTSPSPHTLIPLHLISPLARSFGGNVGHDPHVLYTLSAVQILAIARQLGRLDADKVAAYVASLQQVGA